VEFFFFPFCFFFLLCNLSGLRIEYFIAFFGSLQLILNKVLFLGSPSQTIIGRPIVPDAAVHAVVEEHVSADLPVSNKFDMFGQK
jgi:ribosomal protein L21